MIRPLSALRLLTITTLASITITGCTKPKETTAIGSAAGGAIGAGLGAIIGNQTGNAGSGLAIGAVAGAATGALVGNALQAQQEKINSQNEAIGRQEQAMRAQRSEIEELRRMQSDNSNSYSGKTQTVNAYLVEQKRLQLQKRGPSPKGQSSASQYAPLPLAERNAEPLARYKSESRSIKTAATSAPQKTITETTATTATTAAVSSNAIQERDLASEASNQTAKVVAPSASDSSCEEAKQAREAAASSTEDSDKLFHFRKALRLCPSSAETHYELGQAYLAMNRTADATYEFKQALSINPGYQAAKDSLRDLEQVKSHY